MQAQSSYMTPEERAECEIVILRSQLEDLGEALGRVLRKHSSGGLIADICYCEDCQHARRLLTNMGLLGAGVR